MIDCWSDVVHRYNGDQGSPEISGVDKQHGADDRKSDWQGKGDHGFPGPRSQRTAYLRGGWRLFRVQLLNGLREPAQHLGQDLQLQRVEGVRGPGQPALSGWRRGGFRGDAGRFRLQVQQPPGEVHLRLRQLIPGLTDRFPGLAPFRRTARAPFCVLVAYRSAITSERTAAPAVCPTRSNTSNLQNPDSRRADFLPPGRVLRCAVMRPGHRAPWGCWLLAGVLIAIFLAQGFLASAIKSPVFDETGDIAAGLSYVQAGEIRANLQHPPLLQDRAA